MPTSIELFVIALFNTLIYWIFSFSPMKIFSNEKNIDIFQNNWHHHYRFSRIFRMNLFRCSDTFVIILDKAACFFLSLFFSLFRPNNKQTIEICTKTHIPKVQQKKHLKVTTTRKKMLEKWKYLSLGYAANMNDIFFRVVSVWYKSIQEMFFFLVFVSCSFRLFLNKAPNAGDCYIINTFDSFHLAWQFH